MWETLPDLSSPETPGKLPLRRVTTKKSKWLMFTQSKTEKGERRCLCGRKRSLETFHGPQVKRLALHCGLNNKIKNTYLFFESFLHGMALLQTVEDHLLFIEEAESRSGLACMGLFSP